MTIKQKLRFAILSVLVLFSFQTFAVTPVNDGIITTKIKSKILLDKSLSVFKVNVKTVNGIVNLTGQVKSDTDASALIQLSQATDGVKNVDTTHLIVEGSDQPLSDTAITAKVKGLLIREKLLGKNMPASISVETNNGIVYLSGNVETTQQSKNAVKLAKSVSGVTQVESRLKISN